MLPLKLAETIRLDHIDQTEVSRLIYVDFSLAREQMRTHILVKHACLYRRLYKPGATNSL